MGKRGIKMNFIVSLLFCALLILLIYIPYIIFMGIFAIIIWTITTKKIASKTLKVLIIMVVLLYGTIIIGGFKSETPNDLYTEIKEMDDNQSLIGLSSEEVIKILGKPEAEHNSEGNRKQYVYSAGNVFKESYWGYSYSHDYYKFYVSFDENDKVENTSMKLVPSD